MIGKTFSPPRWLRSLCLLLFLALAGCRGETILPTPARLVATLDATLTPTTPVDLTPDHAETELQSEPKATVNRAVAVPRAAGATSTPQGSGLRPDAAELARPLDVNYSLNEAVSAEDTWRPPPYQVPLSLHPDDHYWLIRPIPSGYRNYDLEWYPYGSDVLIPELAPYRVHHGLDFPNDTGTPVLAASSGKVIWAGPLPSSRDGINYYGNTVIIHHDWQWMGQNVYTLYAHTLELFVEVGDDVNQGELIAGVGASGEVSGAHLHLEVRVGDNHYHTTRNPMLWIAPYEGWGTLAGRFTDRRGQLITGAPITVRPANGAGPTRLSRTYFTGNVKADEIWRENFAVGDLPAGRYTVQLSVNGIIYQRTVDVLPGRTNYVSVQADVAFIPTPTPTPTLTPTLPISGTVPAVGTIPAAP